MEQDTPKIITNEMRGKNIQRRHRRTLVYNIREAAKIRAKVLEQIKKTQQEIDETLVDG